MTDPLFFPRPKGLTVAEIATLTGALVQLGAPLERRVAGIAPLDRAGPNFGHLPGAKGRGKVPQTGRVIVQAMLRSAPT